MVDVHPNVALIQHLDVHRLDEAGELFAPNFVWHYINPNLPGVEGDYKGMQGLRKFFEILTTLTGDRFEVKPVSIAHYGDELVVTHVRNSMVLRGRSINIDAIVVWRIVDGRIAEAWDIPSAYKLASST